MSEQGGGKSAGIVGAYPWMVYRGLRHCWSDRGKVDSRSIETDGRARSPMGTCSRFPDHVRRTAIGAERKRVTPPATSAYHPRTVVRARVIRRQALPLSRRAATTEVGGKRPYA